MSNQEAKKWKIGNWVRVIGILSVYMRDYPYEGYIPKDSIGRVIEVYENKEQILLLFFCPHQDEKGNWDQHHETVMVNFTNSCKVHGGNRTNRLKKIPTLNKQPATTIMRCKED